MAKSPLQKVTVNLYEGDLERLGDLYPKLDKSVALRELVRSHIERVEAAVPAPRVEALEDVLIDGLNILQPE